MKSRVVTLILLYIASCIWAANKPVFVDRIPDSGSVRKDIRETWLYAPFDIVKDKEPTIYKNDQGLNFEVHWEESGDRFAIMLVPETTMDIKTIVNDKVLLEKSKVYMLCAPGTWILYKDKTTSKFIGMRCYYWQDADVYVEFTPDKSRKGVVLADMVVKGCYLARGVQIGLSFDRLCITSFEEIRSRTLKLLPWQKLNIVPGMSSTTIRMMSMVERYLKDPSTAQIIPTVAADGSTINPDLISSDMRLLWWMGCALAYPITEAPIDVGKLVTPTVDYDARGLRGVLSRDKPISMPLDWARNLSTELVNIRYDRHYTSGESGVDVNDSYFVSRLKTGLIESAVGYIKDTGYEMVELEGMLYVLASIASDTIYFAAIKEPSPNPELYMFRKNAAIFPYFDSTGHFGCKVFMGSKEMDIADFVKEYAGCYIHLSRVKSSEVFYPYSH